MEEQMIGAVIVWIVSLLLIIFPQEVLKIQKDIHKPMGVDYIYSEKTVRVIRWVGVLLIGLGFVVWVVG